MRTITRRIVQSFLLGDKRIIANSATDGRALYLHGNKIAEYRTAEDGTLRLYITTAGWKSNTTKERLNGLPRVSIYQKAGVWYLNGQAWDGSWTMVS